MAKCDQLTHLAFKGLKYEMSKLDHVCPIPVYSCQKYTAY